MALDGTSRDETDRYLAENFKLTDRAALLDEVYESVERLTIATPQPVISRIERGLTDGNVCSIN